MVTIYGGNKMPLTEEELESLRLECANAKVRCREVWHTILQLERIARDYLHIHDLWKKRFEKADRALAMEERRKIETIEDRKKKPKSVFQGLSEAQLKAIAIELLEEEGGE